MVASPTLAEASVDILRPKTPHRPRGKCEQFPQKLLAASNGAATWKVVLGRDDDQRVLLTQ